MSPYDGNSSSSFDQDQPRRGSFGGFSIRKFLRSTRWWSSLTLNYTSSKKIAGKRQKDYATNSGKDWGIST